MIITMKPGATKEEIKAIKNKILGFNLKADISQGKTHTVIGIMGDTKELAEDIFKVQPGVSNVKRVSKQYKLVSREFVRKKRTIVKVGSKGQLKIGNSKIAIIAGPCAVESEEQLHNTAIAVKAFGVKLLRGSIFKPRTSPYDFQGLELNGFSVLKSVRESSGMLIETEVMEPEHVGMVDPYVDMLRIGARNMQNFGLLREVGKSNKPVMLKRGMVATYTEFLLAAEYILKKGNPNVVLCERGIRTTVPETRNTPDLTVIPWIKRESHLPIVFDPSHATGDIDLIMPMSRAAIAAGADGLIIEVHCNPREAKSDAKQQLTPVQFKKLLKDIRPIAKAMHRKMD